MTPDPMPYPGFNMGADGSVEALGEIWTGRGVRRATRGNAKRTVAMMTLEILADMGFEDCRTFGEHLGEAWAGEDGWDTEQLIKALSATKSQVQVQPQANDGGRR